MCIALVSLFPVFMSSTFSVVASAKDNYQLRFYNIECVSSFGVDRFLTSFVVLPVMMMMNKDPIGPHVLSAWANVYLIEIYHSSQFRDNRTTFNAHRLLASFAGTSTNLGVRYQHTHNTIYVVCFTTFAIISEEQPTGSVRVLIRRLTLLVHDLSLGVTRYFSLFFTLSANGRNLSLE